MNSALVLAIPREPTEMDNGFLEAWEIFDDIHTNADLVTLSACDTALGEERDGEGLVGLTRAFQVAGARSVLASLWKVDDWRTSTLMERLYRELRYGKSKVDALREAQKQLISSKNASHPVYWAAFTLAGDWK